jgi:hypothetical protein
MILENDSTPRMIQKIETYSCTESFASDMLLYHDNRLLSYLNIVYDDRDCRGGMAVRTLLRALSYKYVKKEVRNGPFPFNSLIYMPAIFSSMKNGMSLVSWI